LTIIKVFSPTDAQLDSLKNNFKFALKLFLRLFNCVSDGGKRNFDKSHNISEDETDSAISKEVYIIPM
jgi:hypothetical protein